jgi:Cd(II)/Pb(II)-responsive transcriptional regulator
MRMAMLKIGELSRQAECPIETIRFYERDGLLPPPLRSAGNYRLYDAALVERLRFIRRCRSLDMSLDEIRGLLHTRDASSADCADVNALLDRHIALVTRRMHELEDLHQELRRLRSRCGTASSAQECGILKELAADRPGES